MKLKLSRPDPNNLNAPSSSVPSTPQVPTPAGSSGGFKLKLKTSQPPTPAGEYAPSQASAPLAPPPVPPPKAKRQYNKKPKDGAQTKKRPADDDISPAPKRPVIDKANRRVSLKINPNYTGDEELVHPGSAGPKLKLSARKQSTGPKVIALVSRKAPPKRLVGVGYDSEASDAEADPLIEEQFVLRMQPGEDCDYLREAIANRTIGLRPEEGGASITMKFLDKDLRRNMITIRGTNYAAALVDLPCIIEGMKSWDKRGWWKVADICQMLLVLGPTESEATAKSHALPKEVDKSTYAYAHGLTPPMHWVRKRRFRKRASYRSMEHIDDEVERLIKADLEAEKSGGGVRFEIKDLDAPPEDTQEEYYDDNDDEPPSGFIDTTEDGYGQAYPAEAEDEEAEEDLEAMLAAEFAMADEDADADAEVDDTQASISIPATATTDPATALSVETPSSNTAAPDTSAAATPAAEASSDEDEEEEEEDDYDEDEGSPDAVDEDLVTKQAELAEQRSQVEDLEREVETARVDYERQKNALLKQRALNKLKSLRDELAMKKRTFGMDDGDEEE